MISINKKNFKKEVLNSKKPVVIDFWAPWCMPCQMMGPVFEEASKELTNLKFVKVNVDENPTISQEYMISGIPTIMVFKNGESIGRFSGYRGKSDLIADIKEIVMTDSMEE